MANLDESAQDAFSPGFPATLVYCPSLPSVLDTYLFLELFPLEVLSAPGPFFSPPLPHLDSILTLPPCLLLRILPMQGFFASLGDPRTFIDKCVTSPLLNELLPDSPLDTPSGSFPFRYTWSLKRPYFISMSACPVQLLKMPLPPSFFFFFTLVIFNFLIPRLDDFE